MTLAELQKLDAGSWFEKRYGDERIPSLIEAAGTCKGRIDLLLDLKEHGDPAQTIIGVRSVEQATRFRKLLPEAKQLALIPDVDSIEAFAEAGVDFIRLWPRWLTESNEPVKRVRASGAKLHLNGESGSFAETPALLSHEPDSLSSDNPRRQRATLSRIENRDLPTIDRNLLFQKFLSARSAAGIEGRGIKGKKLVSLINFQRIQDFRRAIDPQSGEKCANLVGNRDSWTRFPVTSGTRKVSHLFGFRSF